MAVAVLLAGCQSTSTQTHSTVVVATVGRHVILPAQLSAYVRYVVGFDSLAYPDSAEASCTARAVSTPCRRLREQALTRLLQEQVVLDYASTHHIRLSSRERRAIEAEIGQLDGPQAPTRKLFLNGTVDRSFIRSILQRQMLVQKVQAHIAGTRARQGPAFKLRRIQVSFPLGTSRTSVNKQMSGIATGSPLPGGAEDRTDWIADFRLPADIRKALDHARRGSYVGPFLRGDRSLLVQFLDRGVRKYGRPAIRELTATTFARWLHTALRRAHPRCSTKDQRLVPCPARMMKVA